MNPHPPHTPAPAQSDPASPAPRASDAPREYRLGPFVFVSGWRPTPGDPWAHRKSEPRIFALCWAAYLMIGALLTLFASRPSGHYALTHYEYGARALFLITALGAVVLAPMVRLSQARAQRPLRELVVDVLVIVLPAHALIWPFPLLTLWAFETTLALALSITSWTILSFSIAAMALAGGRITRAGAMLSIVLCVGVAPLLLLAGKLWIGVEPHPVLAMLSPFTAAYDLTLAPPGITPRATTTQILLAAAPLVPACLAIALVGARRDADPPGRLH